MDRETQTVQIRESTNTAASRRSIRIFEELAALLRTLKADHAKVALKAETGSDVGDRLVFINFEGRALDPSNLIRRFSTTAIAAAGRPSTTRLYELRHASTSLLVVAGVNFGTVAQRLGHTDAGFKLRIYVRALDKTQGQAVDAMRAKFAL